MLVPGGGRLPDLRLGEQCRQRVCAGLEEEQRLVRSEEDLMPVESLDRLGIERRPHVQQSPNVISRSLFERQYDDQPARLLSSELELGQTFRDLADEIRLCDGWDRKRRPTAERGKARNALSSPPDKQES